MSTLTTFLVTITGLLLTMLGLIAKQDDNIEVRKILAWIVFTATTLLFPSFFVVWLTMQIIARILAPTNIDLSSFTSQVSWWTSGVSMVYPLIWGILIFPKIRDYIQTKILVSPKGQDAKSNTDLPKCRGQNKP